MTATPHDDGAPVPPADLTLYTDAEAHAIWARGAQLQAETDADVRRAWGAPAAPPAAHEAGALVRTAPAGMFLAAEVRAAAREAGIDAACIALAMAEHEASGRETSLVPGDDDVRRFVRELGTATGSIRAVALVAGDRDAVIARLRATLAGSPYLCTFAGRVVVDAEAGEVLSFALPQWGAEVDGEPTITNAFVYHANRIGVGAVHVLVAPRGTRERPACELTLVADLRAGAHFNAGFMRVARPAMLPLATVAGWLLGAAVTGAPSLTAEPALVGAAIGTGVGGLVVAGLRRVMRWEQRTAMRVLQRAFDTLARAVGRPGGAPPLAAADATRARAIAPGDGATDLRAMRAAAVA